MTKLRQTLPATRFIASNFPVLIDGLDRVTEFASLLFERSGQPIGMVQNATTTPVALIV